MNIPTKVLPRKRTPAAALRGTPYRWLSHLGLILLTSLLLACSDDGDSNYEDESYAHMDDAGNYDDYTDSGYDEEFSEDAAYQPDPNEWRKGTLEISLHIEQAAKYKEAETYPSGLEKSQTSINWNYEIKAHRKEAVWLKNDQFEIMPRGSEEERFDALESGPYSEVDDGNAEVGGTVTFVLLYNNETPEGTYTKSMEKSLRGETTIDTFEIRDLVPSLYGPDYELHLKLGFDLPLKGYLSTVLKNGDKQHIDESRDHEVNFRPTIYPTLNDDHLNDYPYLYEYAEMDGDIGKSVIDAAKQAKLDVFKRLKAIEANQADFLQNELVGMVSKRTKDSLTIHYEFTDNTLLPVIAHTEMTVATPDKTSFVLELKLSAN